MPGSLSPFLLFSFPHRSYNEVINTRAERRYVSTIMLHENRVSYRVPVVIIYGQTRCCDIGVLWSPVEAHPGQRHPPVAECGPADREYVSIPIDSLPILIIH
ncbi:hypothetical protein X777_09034 [Ooceraea biroi]|uniref:Uncharacterized protein n=1 Tax=Ooceraea biroi TaxID=2015173 RepID=A0A026WBE4_OOCBI|nr:hypothetical protein X777_09034 [Ooceraea biroi]